MFTLGSREEIATGCFAIMMLMNILDLMMLVKMLVGQQHKQWHESKYFHAMKSSRFKILASMNHELRTIS